MLRKLMKYELKATGRTLLPFYVTALALAVINRFIFGDAVFSQNAYFPSHWTAGISVMLYAFVICAIFVMTLIITIQRFYKNLLGDEGYLMFTLPVKTWQHITSKMLVAGLWFIVSTIVTFVTLLVIGANALILEEMGRGLSQLFAALYQRLGIHGYLYLLEGALMVIVTLLASVLMIYVAIALGHLFQKHRVIASFGAYLAVNFLFQIITSAAIVTGMRFLERQSIYQQFYDHQFALAHTMFISYTLWYAIFGAVYFFATKWILTKRLNLE